MVGRHGRGDSGIPQNGIPDVLLRLGNAAAELAKTSGQDGEAAQAHQQLAEIYLSEDTGTEGRRETRPSDP